MVQLSYLKLVLILFKHGIKRSEIKLAESAQISNEELKKIESYKLLISQFTELVQTNERTNK